MSFWDRFRKKKENKKQEKKKQEEKDDKATVNSVMLLKNKSPFAWSIEDVLTWIKARNFVHFHKIIIFLQIPFHQCHHHKK